MPVPLPYPVLMPDTPEEIVAEIGNSRALRRLKRELISGAQFQQEYAIFRQRQVHEASRIIEHRAAEGVGQLIGRIDKELYFQYIKLYGPECWGDPAFVQDTLDKNPWMRIHTRFPTRIRVDGFRRPADKETSADGNRASGRAYDAFPNLVQAIEHPAVAPADGKDHSQSFRILPSPGVLEVRN